MLATLGGHSTTQETADAITAALTNYFTQAEVTFNLVAAVDRVQGLHGCAAGRLQRHRCNEPGHRGCPRALRDHRPA